MAKREAREKKLVTYNVRLKLPLPLALSIAGEANKNMRSLPAEIALRLGRSIRAKRQLAKKV
jgi:hypothetical protein